MFFFYVNLLKLDHDIERLTVATRILVATSISLVASPLVTLLLGTVLSCGKPPLIFLKHKTLE